MVKQVLACWFWIIIWKYDSLSRQIVRAEVLCYCSLWDRNWGHFNIPWYLDCDEIWSYCIITFLDRFKLGIKVLSTSLRGCLRRLWKEVERCNWRHVTFVNSRTPVLFHNLPNVRLGALSRSLQSSITVAIWEMQKMKLFKGHVLAPFRGTRFATSKLSGRSPKPAVTLSWLPCACYAFTTNPPDLIILPLSLIYCCIIGSMKDGRHRWL